MGQRNGPSDMDILKIYKMYKCETKTDEAAAAKNDHSVGCGCNPNIYATYFFLIESLLV